MIPKEEDQQGLCVMQSLKAFPCKSHVTSKHAPSQPSPSRSVRRAAAQTAAAMPAAEPSHYACWSCGTHLITMSFAHLSHIPMAGASEWYTRRGYVGRYIAVWLLSGTSRRWTLAMWSANHYPCGGRQRRPGDLQPHCSRGCQPEVEMDNAERSEREAFS